MNAKKIAKVIIDAFRRGNKLMICGNGGSAAQAQHMAAELVGKYKHERRALPAIALTTDTSILTAVGNDIGFEEVFSRQIEAYGKPGDIVLTLSTSGASENLVFAIGSAHEMGLRIIDLPRKGKDTPAIQENQLSAIHRICELVEEAFVEDNQ